MKQKSMYTWILLISMLLSTCVYAASESTTTSAYRVMPLQEKLAAMTQKDIDQSVGRFSDVGKHWAASSIGKLTSLGVLSGCGDGTFKPERQVSIDEFISMTVRSLGLMPESESKYWAQPYIDIAKAQKLIDESEFENYAKPIKREQAVRIAVKALMLYETAPNPSIYDYIRGKIRDYPYVGDEYKQYVLQAYATGIIAGNPEGYFNADNSLTRAEAATIILRNLDVDSRSPMKPDESEVLVIADSMGKTYEIYPKERPELFQTAVVLKENVSKTKGFGMMDYNPYDQLISASFYNDKVAMEESDLNIQLIFTIYPADTKNQDPTYVVTVCDPRQTKELHMEFITAVFHSLFDKDADIALSQFEKNTDLFTKSEAAYEENLSLNNRKVIFYKVAGHESFSVRIFLKD